MISSDIEILRKIAAVLEDLEITYWADSGTLLGLHRDGCFIPNDKDIDLSILASDKSYDDLIASLRNLNLGRILIKKYGCRIHKIKVIRGLNQRTIDISLFRMHKEKLNMPVLRLNKIKEAFNASNYRTAFQLILAKLFLECQKFISGEIDYSNNLYKDLLRTEELWEYPENLVIPVDTANRHGISFPKNVEKYLEYRYGSWMIPIAKWTSERSDKAFLRNETYYELL